MTWLDVPVIASLLLYLLAVARKRGFLTADALFAYFQLTIVVGTLPLLDPSVRADVVYGYVLVYCFIAYVLTCILVHGITPHSRTGLVRASPRIIVTRLSGRIWALIVLSLGITLLYYASVGYSAFLVGLRAQLSGNSAVDIATLRLNSYSGSQYFAPGYVNQFKNALLPALVILAITYFATTRFRHRIVIGVLTVLTLLGVLGTGQRGAFVQIIVIVLVYLYLLDRSRFRHRFFIVAVFGLAVSSVSTFALGRSSAQVNAANGLVGKIGAVFTELWSRIIASNQSSGIAGFRYTYGLPNQHGREWVQGLLALLPGPFKTQGPTLDNYIFASLYGDTRGTSPPSLWGSIYYNFGLIGIVVMPVLFAIALRRLSDRALGRSTYTTLEIVGIAGTFGCVGSWVADGPNYLANAGTIMYALMWYVGRRAARRAELADGTAASRGGARPTTRRRAVGPSAKRRTTAIPLATGIERREHARSMRGTNRGQPHV